VGNRKGERKAESFKRSHEQGLGSENYEKRLRSCRENRASEKKNPRGSHPSRKATTTLEGGEPLNLREEPYTRLTCRELTGGSSSRKEVEFHLVRRREHEKGQPERGGD